MVATSRDPDYAAMQVKGGMTKRPRLDEVLPEAEHGADGEAMFATVTIISSIGQHGEACQCGDLSKYANSQSAKLDVYSCLLIETLGQSLENSEATVRVGNLQPRKELVRAYGYTTGGEYTTKIPLHVIV